jgi:integrase
LSKKAELLKDPDVARWNTNVARGSPLTADVNLRRLSLFCEQNDLTPKELTALGKKNKKQLEDLIQDHITKMESESKSPGYIAGILKGVKSWLVHNDIELKRKIRISNRGATPTIEDERVPEKEELKALLIYGDERTSAIICLVAQSGVRLEVLGNARGNDGLTVGDLPELKVLGDHVEFARIPSMIVVRPSLSKVNHRYITFLPKEGCDHLGAYLNRRLADGEEFTPKTPVIATKTGFRKGEETGSQFMTTRNVSKIIRRTMRPRFTWRPYVLRAYFATQMLLAESHGKVSHPYRVFFMGHKGDIEARYTTNKGRLPENLVEDMRSAFAASTEYLETTPRPERDKKEMLLEMWRQQAKMYGIDPMKVKIEKERELGKELSVDEEQELLTTEIKKLTMPQLSDNGKPYQSKIIREKELLPHVEDGWEIVRELSSRKFLIKKPNHTV